MHRIRKQFTIVWQKIASHKRHALPIVLVTAWCFPYFVMGNRIEWGDFSFFSQAYEAIRVHIVHYHQFPWWNPWESGGVPLYGDPQMGVFSIQTLFVLAFGAPVGLQLTVALFTYLGYASMYLLARRYFRADTTVAILVSLLWVFSSFFVAHLPSHFTFIWYLVAPYFVYLSLWVRGWRSGVVMGISYGLMALSSVHNAFFHTMLVCAGVLLVRLVLQRSQWKPIAVGVITAGGVFIALAGHRIVYAYQYVHHFHKVGDDPAPAVMDSVSGLFLPFSRAHPLNDIIDYPEALYGFGELSGTIGILATVACAVMLVFFVRQVMRNGWRQILRKRSFALLSIVLVLGAVCGLLGLGSFVTLSPYTVLKQLPVFGEMRVPSRWFLWCNLAMLLFVASAVTALRLRAKVRVATIVLLMAGVAELFLLNVGYQPTVLSHTAVTAPKPITAYTFSQHRVFGEVTQLSDGSQIVSTVEPLPHPYGEYEATTFNMGTIEGNDVLMDLRGDYNTKRCSILEGCGFIIANNARVAFWSPERIVLERTAPGEIRVNMNESRYFLVNGKRNKAIRVAEPYKDFILAVPDNEQRIELRVQPSITGIPYL